MFGQRLRLSVWSVKFNETKADACMATKKIPVLVCDEHYTPLLFSDHT